MGAAGWAHTVEGSSRAEQPAAAARTSPSTPRTLFFRCSSTRTRTTLLLFHPPEAPRLCDGDLAELARPRVLGAHIQDACRGQGRAGQGRAGQGRGADAGAGAGAGSEIRQAGRQAGRRMSRGSGMRQALGRAAGQGSTPSMRNHQQPPAAHRVHINESKDRWENMKIHERTGPTHPPTVCIDGEGDLDLGDAAGGRRDACGGTKVPGRDRPVTGWNGREGPAAGTAGQVQRTPGTAGTAAGNAASAAGTAGTGANL